MTVEGWTRASRAASRGVKKGRLTGMRRVRVGQLRIVYRVSTAGVEVVAIGPPRGIYTALEREARRAVAGR